MLPGANPVKLAPEYNYFGSLVPRPRECYYPETRTVGLELRWHHKPWEVQHDRNVPLRPLQSKEAKAPPSPTSRVRDGPVQPRTEENNEMQVMDFESYAAHFAVTPERQAEVDAEIDGCRARSRDRRKESSR